MSNGVPDPFTVEPKLYGNCVFTRDEAEGALPNGTTVRKVFSEDEGDTTPPGTLGTIVGSLGGAREALEALSGVERAAMDPRCFSSEHVYFIEWRDNPQAVIGCVSAKVEKV